MLPGQSVSQTRERDGAVNNGVEDDHFQPVVSPAEALKATFFAGVQYHNRNRPTLEEITTRVLRDRPWGQNRESVAPDIEMAMQILETNGLVEKNKRGAWKVTKQGAATAQQWVPPVPTPNGVVVLRAVKNAQYPAMGDRERTMGAVIGDQLPRPHRVDISEELVMLEAQGFVRQPWFTSADDAHSRPYGSYRPTTRGSDLIVVLDENPQFGPEHALAQLTGKSVAELTV